MYVFIIYHMWGTMLGTMRVNAKEDSHALWHHGAEIVTNYIKPWGGFAAYNWDHSMQQNHLMV